MRIRDRMGRHSKISVNFSSYKEIIKLLIIYHSDHSRVRAKDHNRVSNPTLKGLGLQE
jgi:hypothetical protein